MIATILLFHRISPVRDALWDPMDPRLFDRVLSRVTKKYNIVGLEELCLGGTKSTKPLMAITFDDGYRDFIGYALPILHKYRCPSSMYVVTDCVDRNVPPWTYVVDILFLSTRKLRIRSADYGPGCAAFHTFKWSSDRERMRYGSQFKQFLKQVDSLQRGRVIDHLLRSFDDVESPTGMMMTWDDIRRLASENVEIGSHSITHPPFATISDEAELIREMRGSAEKIQKECGKFPQAISYPVGSYNRKVMDAAKNCGYKLGLAVDQRRYRAGHDELYAIPRIELYNESMFRTAARISGAYGMVKRLLGRSPSGIQQN